MLTNTYERQKQRADEPKYHSTMTIEIVRVASVRSDVMKLLVWTKELKCTLHIPSDHNKFKQASTGCEAQLAGKHLFTPLFAMGNYDP